jgi:hypothetical protein
MHAAWQQSRNVQSHATGTFRLGCCFKWSRHATEDQGTLMASACWSSQHGMFVMGMISLQSTTHPCIPSTAGPALRLS